MTASGGFINVKTNSKILEIDIIKSKFSNSIIMYNGGVFIINSEDVELYLNIDDCSFNNIYSLSYYGSAGLQIITNQLRIPPLNIETFINI